VHEVILIGSMRVAVWLGRRKEGDSQVVRQRNCIADKGLERVPVELDTAKIHLGIPNHVHTAVFLFFLNHSSRLHCLKLKEGTAHPTSLDTP
jgi:hypothetical protein